MGFKRVGYTVGFIYNSTTNALSKNIGTFVPISALSQYLYFKVGKMKDNKFLENITGWNFNIRFYKWFLEKNSALLKLKNQNKIEKLELMISYETNLLFILLFFPLSGQ